MTGEVLTKSLVYALVQEEAHLMAGEQGFRRFFQSLQGLLPADGGEPLEEALQTVSGLEVLEESAHQDPRASKRRRAGHNGGIANDDGLHVFIVPQLSTRVVSRRPTERRRRFTGASCGTGFATLYVSR